MNDSYRIVIYGAGSVGCYLGGRLLSAGADVTFIGREKLQKVLADKPLVITDYRGFRFETHLRPAQFSTGPEAARDADLVILATKSAGTEQAGEELAKVLKPGTPVISFQNGISNAERLREKLPECTVLAGMIPFNVLQKSPGHFHHGTEGQLKVAASPDIELALARFERAGLPLEERDDMQAVLWSKLLLNLNNPINALSGVPLKEELEQRDYRRCLAMAQEETLTLLEKSGIHTIKLTPLPMEALPYVMRTPNWLFTRIAKRMITIDPLARSSMWEDIEAGRPTEVDYLNGEVVALATSLNTRAPVNQALTQLIHQCEHDPTQAWPAPALLAHLKGVLDDYHAR